MRRVRLGDYRIVLGDWFVGHRFLRNAVVGYWSLVVGAPKTAPIFANDEQLMTNR
jgi:hypothetical protein